jgi:hypothetical protein
VVAILRIEEINGIYVIVNNIDENFWQSLFIKTGEVASGRPRLKDSLAQWWDQTAPGEWTTAYLSNPSRRVIVIRDPSLFMLFKLAFSNSEEISNEVVILDSACYFAPYVSLTALQNPHPVFKSDHDDEDDQAGQYKGSQS